MNRKSKLLALLLTLVLCVSVFSAVRVFAVEDETVETTPAEVETVETDPPPETDPPVTQTSPPPETQEQYDPPETYEPETEQQYEAEDNNDSNNNDYNYDEENYDDSGSESYEERESNTTNEKAETAAVFDAEKDDVSTDTLKKSDWAKIAEQLKNANGDGSDDFAFIRNNDQGGANNGEWMLILGIAMEALGLGIIIFLIVSKARMKKAMETNGGKGGRNGRGGSRPSSESAPERRERQARRSEPEQKAQRTTKKQRSKFDTADIELPRHAKKPSGGSRYKPRH